MQASFRSRWAWNPPGTTLGDSARFAAFALMAVYLWFLPIGHTIAVRHLAFFPLVLLTFWAAWRNELRLYMPVKWAWLFYAVIALISVGYAVNPTYSFGEVRQEVGYSILAMLLAASWIRDTASFSRLVMLLIMGDVLMVGYALYNGFVLAPFWRQPVMQVTSLNNGVGTFSTYLITVMPFITAYALLLPRRAVAGRGLVFGLLACNLLALYLTGNRAGLLTLLVEIALTFAFAYSGSLSRISLKTAGLIFVVLAMVGGLAISQLSHRSPTNDVRWELWGVAIGYIEARPLTGGGFGREAFKLLNPEYYRMHPQLWHAHNMIMNKGVQMGIPGMAAFTLLLAAAFRAVWPSRELRARDGTAWVYAVAGAVMIAGTIVKNMTDDFFIDDSGFLFWLLVGAVAGALTQTPGTAPKNG